MSKARTYPAHARAQITTRGPKARPSIPPILVVHGLQALADDLVRPLLELLVVVGLAQQHEHMRFALRLPGELGVASLLSALRSGPLWAPEKGKVQEAGQCSKMQS